MRPLPRKRIWRKPSLQRIEPRDMLAADPFGTNSIQKLDVSGDGFVTALDALQIINSFDRSSTQLVAQPSEWIGRFIDVSGDGVGTSLDALRVINALNGQQPLLGAALSVDSKPLGNAASGFDLRTNRYGLDIKISVAELGDASVALTIGADGNGNDITGLFADNKSSLSEAQIDEFFGGPLPDGDHLITIELTDGGDARNWESGTVPTADDVVLISLPGAERVVLPSTAVKVKHLTTTSELVVSSSSLEAGVLDLDGGSLTISRRRIDTIVTSRRGGGSIKLAVFAEFKNVMLDVPLTLTGSLNVTDGLTINSNITMAVSASSSSNLNFVGEQFIGGTGTIIFSGEPRFSSFNLIRNSGAGIVTIADSLTIQGKFGQFKWVQCWRW